VTIAEADGENTDRNRVIHFIPHLLTTLHARRTPRMKRPGDGIPGRESGILRMDRRIPQVPPRNRARREMRGVEMNPLRAHLPLLGVLLAVAACASTPAARPAAAVPENLRVPEGEPLLLRAAARGAQIYTCKAKAAEPAAFEWALKAPDAELFDQAGAKIGRHYIGPTWESADGSRVAGEVLQRSAVPGAVAWLLMRAKSTEGTGTLAGVHYIQRVDTVGGVAPSSGCDAAHADAEARVEYSANYDFYGTR
jgi:Protein of unknown function (DUF3455)